MPHQKGLHATVSFVLGVEGVNFLTSTLKFKYSVADSTVPVTVVPCILVQATVCLARRKRRFSKLHWSLISSLSSSSFVVSRSFFCHNFPL